SNSFFMVEPPQVSGLILGLGSPPRRYKAMGKWHFGREWALILAPCCRSATNPYWLRRSLPAVVPEATRNPCSCPFRRRPVHARGYRDPAIVPYRRATIHRPPRSIPTGDRVPPARAL